MLPFVLFRITLRSIREPAAWLVGRQPASHSRPWVVLDGQGKLRQDGITDHVEVRSHRGGNTVALAEDVFPGKVNSKGALAGLRPSIEVPGLAQNTQR